MSRTNTPSPSRVTPRALALAAVVATVLAAVYMITYSAQIETGDELYLFDAVGSVVQFGDFKLDVTAGSRPPQSFENVESYPLPTVDAEPLQILLAAPLYALASAIPGIGLAHATWLFNVLVCALAGGVILLFALSLGATERGAVLAALAFGLATVYWPYSRSFFREPLTGLMILLAAFFAVRWRASGYRSPALLLALLIAIVGMLLARATSALALPGLVVLALPPLSRANWRRAVVVVLVLLAVVLALFVLLSLADEALGVGGRYNPLARIIGDTRYVGRALHTYLLSVGGSVWGTSPVLLLALPGAWWLWRQGRGRVAIAALLVLLAFAFGYARASGAFWFGGLSWPPRFLVPTVPLLMLLTVPAFDRLTRRPPWLLAFAALALVAYGIWIQLSGVTLPWGDYVLGLPPEARGLLEWSGGLNQLQYLRWSVIPALWAAQPLAFAWTRLNLPGWPLAFAGLALLGLLWLLALAFRPSAHRWLRIAPAFPLTFVAFVGLGLRALYPDPYYLPDRPGLVPMLAIIEQETGPGDVLLLGSREYERFMLNYGKLSDVRIVGLGDQPGDRPSETQMPAIMTENPDLRLTRYTIPFIHSLAATRPRLWLLENRGPDFDWAVRPVERFLAAHYYPIRVLQTDPPDPTVRLIEISTATAPDPYAFRGPETLADLHFGGQIRLNGYTLPLGDTYAPGDALPVSLSWQATRPPERDVRVALFLRAADGSPAVQGYDTRPHGDFELTSTWTVGVPVWDHRALRLPDDLPPGDYRLWIKLYAFDETLTPRDLPVTGDDALDATIGLLPTPIHVR